MKLKLILLMGALIVFPSSFIAIANMYTPLPEERTINRNSQHGLTSGSNIVMYPNISGSEINSKKNDSLCQELSSQKHSSSRDVWPFRYKDLKPATGPLVQSSVNPRYFADGSGKPIYLVGSHTWSNFQDLFFEGDKRFNNEEYINFMVDNHFNFMRLWTWEHAAWTDWTTEKMIVDPMPYRRSGPGFAMDGKPKFDLTQFNEAYFDLLRARIINARDHGIYVSVMLFQGWSNGRWYERPGNAFKGNNYDWYPGNAFKGHHYNKYNNIQAFNGDKDNNNILDYSDPGVRDYQVAYIRRVIDCVWDLDNVLYEVINEGGYPEWDGFVIQTVKDYEKTKGKAHPIGITGHGGTKLGDMLASYAEWISPGCLDDLRFKDVKNNPPVWDGKKVSLLDTDHIWGTGINYRWVWKSFLTGHNVLFMDPWDRIPGAPMIERAPDKPEYIMARKAMKNTAIWASKIDLEKMYPSNDVAPGSFCLMNIGKEYLIYVPGPEAELDLTGVSGTFTVEWIHPIEGSVKEGNNISGGKKVRLFTSFQEDGVVHLKLISNN